MVKVWAAKIGGASVGTELCAYRMWTGQSEAGLAQFRVISKKKHKHSLG